MEVIAPVEILNDFGKINPPESAIHYATSIFCEVDCIVNAHTVRVIPITKERTRFRIIDMDPHRICATFHPVSKMWTHCRIISSNRTDKTYKIYLPDYKEQLVVRSPAIRDIPPSFRMERQKPIDVVLYDFNFHKSQHENVIMELGFFVGKQLMADIRGIDIYGNLIVSLFDFDEKSYIFDYVRDRVDFFRCMLNPKDKLKKVPLFDEEESVINVLQRNISAIEEKRQLEAAELNDVKEEKERYKISMYSVRKYLKKYYPLHTVEECAAGNRIIINVKCITRFGMKGARVLFGGNETIHLKLHSIAKGGNKHPSHKRFIELVKESDLVDKIYSCPCHSIPLKKLISYNPARLVYVEFLREGIFKTIDPGLWDIGYPFSKPMSSELSEIIENYYKINDKKVAGNK